MTIYWLWKSEARRVPRALEFDGSQQVQVARVRDAIVRQQHLDQKGRKETTPFHVILVRKDTGAVCHDEDWLSDHTLLLVSRQPQSTAPTLKLQAPTAVPTAPPTPVATPSSPPRVGRWWPLLCRSCEQFLVDAVTTPCCRTSLCHDCAERLDGCPCPTCQDELDAETCKANWPLQGAVDRARKEHARARSPQRARSPRRTG